MFEALTCSTKHLPKKKTIKISVDGMFSEVRFVILLRLFWLMFYSVSQFVYYQKMVLLHVKDQ